MPHAKRSLQLDASLLHPLLRDSATWRQGTQRTHTFSICTEQFTITTTITNHVARIEEEFQLL